MIHALENRGEVNLLAVTITKDNRQAATVDLVNHFWGRSDIPIGVVRNGQDYRGRTDAEGSGGATGANGRFVFPWRIRESSQSPEAVDYSSRY
jgi:hypothetical protein